MKARIMNNVINRLDPCKDAAEGGSLKQSEPNHKRKVLSAINALFRPISDIDTLPTLSTTVIGDTKNAMWARISAEYSAVPMLQNKQQLTRLKASPTGVDNRYTGMYVAHDAGLAPSGLFSTDYRLVITPGSILDPAAKIKSRGPIDILSSITVPNTFPFGKLQEIAMDTAIPRDILFSAPTPETPFYKFEIPTVAGLIEVIFDNQYQATGDASAYFAGNNTKNSYIARADASPAEVQKFIIAKEIGDTLQVCWLKQILGTPALKPADMDLTNTAIMSCDKVVWFRSIVNNISTFLSAGNTVTYYPAMDDATYQSTMKRKLAADLARNNEAVILMIKNLLLEMENNNDASFEGLDISSENVQAINLLTELVRRLDIITQYMNAIVGSQQLQTIAPMAEFTNAVAKLTMCCPIVKRGPAYKFSRTFKRFLPYNDTNLLGIGVLPFNPQNIWAAFRNNMPDPTNSLSGIPNLPAPGPLPAVFPQQGGAGPIYEPAINPTPYGPTDIEYIDGLIKEPSNSTIPGFSAYIMLTYFPEVLYMGYAAYKHVNPAAAQTPIDDLITEGPHLQRLTDSFHNNVGYRFANNVGFNAVLFSELDEATKRLCQYALPVIRNMIGAGQYQIVTSLLVGAAAIPEFTDADIMDIWGIYQQMYYSDLVSNIQNIHDTVGYNPYNFILNESAIADNGLGVPTAPLYNPFTWSPSVIAGNQRRQEIEQALIDTEENARAEESRAQRRVDRMKAEEDLVRELSFRICMFVLFNDVNVMPADKIKLYKLLKDETYKEIYNSLDNHTMNKEIVQLWNETISIPAIRYGSKKNKRDYIKKQIQEIIRKYAARPIMYEVEKEVEEDTNMSGVTGGGAGGMWGGARRRSHKRYAKTRKGAAARRRRTIRRRK